MAAYSQAYREWQVGRQSRGPQDAPLVRPSLPTVLEAVSIAWRLPPLLYRCYLLCQY